MDPSAPSDQITCPSVYSDRVSRAQRRSALTLALLVCAACPSASTPPVSSSPPAAWHHAEGGDHEGPPASAACGEPGSTTPPAAVAQLTAFHHNACARLVDGSVWCWGARGSTLVDADVIGNVACPVATRVSELSPAADLRGSCITRDDGTTRCTDLANWSFVEKWSPDEQQTAAFGDVELDEVAYVDGAVCALSRGTVTCRIVDDDIIVGTDIAALASGDRGLLVIRNDDTLVRLAWCGAKLCEEPLPAIRSGAVAVENGGGETYVLARDGHVWREQLWREYPRDQWPPKDIGFVEVAGVAEATAIAVGLDHACVIRRDGAVVCWGGSHCGQAGGPVKGGDACRMRTQVEPTPIVWAK